MEKIYRYPGSKPFTIEYKDLFYGRENDINDLSKFISTEKLTVLYGKSGLGKSSLLNVGVIPRFENEYHYFHLPVRFGSFNEFNAAKPLALFLEKINVVKPVANFLNKIENEDISLWQYFKSLQLQFPEKKGFLLTCDQFEELFTYPDGIQEFVTQFAELLNNRMPKSFRKAFQRKLKENPDLLTDEEIESLEEPINIKVVISIRSDKLSLLNQLSETIPTILRNCYELKPLTDEQAIDAIVNPAQKTEGQYFSPLFEYDSLALKEIISFLSKNGQQKIETFLLQIICQYVESIVIKHHLTDIQTADLGDLQYISKNYYDTIIAQLPVESQQAARVLIEEGLIFEEDERRLSLYEGQILKQYGVSKELLQQLVNSHFLRAEPYHAGGFVYEISHDTLVAPVLQAKKDRKEKEFAINQEKKILEYEKEILEIKNKQKEVKDVVFILISQLTAILPHKNRFPNEEFELFVNQTINSFISFYNDDSSYEFSASDMLKREIAKYNLDYVENYFSKIILPEAHQVLLNELINDKRNLLSHLYLNSIGYENYKIENSKLTDRLIYLISEMDEEGIFQKNEKSEVQVEIENLKFEIENLMERFHNHNDLILTSSKLSILCDSEQKKIISSGDIRYQLKMIKLTIDGFKLENGIL